MTRSGAGNRFRQRKLSTKQSLAVLRENQIDSVDDDAQRNIPPIETGVERQEEIVRCPLLLSGAIFGTPPDSFLPEQEVFDMQHHHNNHHLFGV